MKKYSIVLFLLITSFNCKNSSVTQDICYDELTEFIGKITHRYEIIIYSMDKLNACFIKNNPDITISSEIYVSRNRNSSLKKFMESESKVNSLGCVEQRESKIFWKYEDEPGYIISEMKWKYSYNNNALVKEVHYNSMPDSSNPERKNWIADDKNEIRHDSIGRIVSNVRYNSYKNSPWNLEGKRIFYYSGYTEIEKYDDYHIQDKWKYIREKDKKGKLLKELTYIFRNDKWMLYSKREFHYSYNSKKEKEYFEYWNWFDNKLEEKYSRSYIYNKEKRLSKVITASERFYSNNKNEVYQDTVRYEYYSNGYLKKIDYGGAFFVLEYSDNGLIEKFVWRNIYENKISDALVISQKVY